MFTAKSAHYKRNIRQGQTYKARPAILTTPDGEAEPAVVIHYSGAVNGVLPIPAALKLANQIADAVEAHDHKTERDN